MPVDIEKKVVLRNADKSVLLRVEHKQVHGKGEDADMQVELIEESSGYGMNERDSRSIWFRVTRLDLLEFMSEVERLIERLPVSGDDSNE